MRRGGGDGPQGPVVGLERGGGPGHGAEGGGCGAGVEGGGGGRPGFGSKGVGGSQFGAGGGGAARGACGAGGQKPAETRLSVRPFTPPTPRSSGWAQDPHKAQRGGGRTHTLTHTPRVLRPRSAPPPPPRSVSSGGVSPPISPSSQPPCWGGGQPAILGARSSRPAPAVGHRGPLWCWGGGTRTRPRAVEGGGGGRR